MFLYAFMSGASISFTHLFLRSLNEVHRSYVVGHALIYPIFIHRILLFLGLADFPSSEPVHVWSGGWTICLLAFFFFFLLLHIIVTQNIIII